jgi:hypothetical protein
VTISEVKARARALGILPPSMDKADLIHAIQRKEGYTPCFGTSGGNCPYGDCCFRSDCLKSKPKSKTK